MSLQPSVAAHILMTSSSPTALLSETNTPSTSQATTSGLCDEKTVEYLRDVIAEKQLIESQLLMGRLDPTPGATGGGKRLMVQLLEQGR